MRKQKSLVVIFSLLALIAIFMLAFNSTATRRIIDDKLFDNYNHYLSCERLPSIKEVEEVVNTHKEEINKMVREASSNFHNTPVTPKWSGHSVIDPNLSYVSFNWGEVQTCQGKADILITYPNHNTRKIIEMYLKNNTFYGIPIRMLNN